MNEEIKEILDSFKQVYEDNNNGIKYEDFNTGYMKIPTIELYPGDCKLLYDYITNLQKSMEQTEIYKSRCKKVNKLITDFMCTEEYCNVDPIAIAENYMKIQKALIGSDENE